MPDNLSFLAQILLEFSQNKTKKTIKRRNYKEKSQVGHKDASYVGKVKALSVPMNSIHYFWAKYFLETLARHLRF